MNLYGTEVVGLVRNHNKGRKVDFRHLSEDYLESKRRHEISYSLNPCKVIIATRFNASTPQKIPTTLKRGGRDFSAAIMCALFRVLLGHKLDKCR